MLEILAMTQHKQVSLVYQLLALVSELNYSFKRVEVLPNIENNYAQNHLRDVSYQDYYQYTLRNIADGGKGSYNHLVSNGISNF